jgi:hypothetical protein
LRSIITNTAVARLVAMIVQPVSFESSSSLMQVESVRSRSAKGSLVERSRTKFGSAAIMAYSDAASPRNMPQTSSVS